MISKTRLARFCYRQPKLRSNFLAFKSKKTSGVTLLELVVVLAVIMVISGAVFIGTSGNTNDYRNLHNASIILQADIRYAQRRAVTEGRRFGIQLQPQLNRYSIISLYPFFEIHRTIYFRDGVTLRPTNFPDNTIMFLPRGTINRAGTVELRNGRYSQNLTATVGAGRIYVYSITN